MRRTINIWWVIVFTACILVAFFWYSNQLSTTIHELQNEVEAGNVKLNKLQSENAKLEAMLKEAGTDGFVEDQARNEYDYMMPDEIRFVITGTENNNQTEVPSP